jgi:hypothetical protein
MFEVRNSRYWRRRLSCRPLAVGLGEDNLVGPTGSVHCKDNDHMLCDMG